MGRHARVILLMDPLPPGWKNLRFDDTTYRQNVRNNRSIPSQYPTYRFTLINNRERVTSFVDIASGGDLRSLNILLSISYAAIVSDDVPGHVL